MFNRHTFSSGPWWESPFRKGTLKYVILDMIRDKPCYGYEIIRALEERSHGFYTPSPGVVYPTVRMLEEMGYVAAARQDGKKVYTITGEGRRFLAERKDRADEIKSQMRHHWEPDNMAEIGATMDEFGRFQHLLHRRLRHIDAEKTRRIREVISRAYEDIEGILAEEVEELAQSRVSKEHV